MRSLSVVIRDPAALAVLGVCTIACAGLAARFFRWE